MSHGVAMIAIAQVTSSTSENTIPVSEIDIFT
jgi:hypothetical protein